MNTDNTDKKSICQWIQQSVFEIKKNGRKILEIKRNERRKKIVLGGSRGNVFKLNVFKLNAFKLNGTMRSCSMGNVFKKDFGSPAP